MTSLSWFLFTTLTVDLPPEEIVDEVRDFDERFGVILLRKHLLYWAGGVSSTHRWRTRNVLYRKEWLWYFMFMNMTWASSTLLLYAGFSTMFSFRLRGGQRLPAVRSAKRHVEKMLLFNIGPDTAYLCLLSG